MSGEDLSVSEVLRAVPAPEADFALVSARFGHLSVMSLPLMTIENLFPIPQASFLTDLAYSLLIFTVLLRVPGGLVVGVKFHQGEHVGIGELLPLGVVVHDLHTCEDVERVRVCGRSAFLEATRPSWYLGLTLLRLTLTCRTFLATGTWNRSVLRLTLTCRTFLATGPWNRSVLIRILAL